MPYYVILYRASSNLTSLMFSLGAYPRFWARPDGFSKPVRSGAPKFRIHPLSLGAFKFLGETLRVSETLRVYIGYGVLVGVGCGPGADSGWLCGATSSPCPV